ncbi:hypothetical protein HMPREF1990_00463 [Porphyromonas gingivalis W4087]|nr:hypothetical protein HMPREF1990_00463 [Porphyromonas gingivalis W4087]PDP62299.1 hypothetical protein CLI83_06105 [Porphyromonas gingivalis]PDP75527.1 hypothetical protein CLI79_03380 [Porphyromonas gingivalis]
MIVAKKQKKKAFSFQGFDLAHYKTTVAYTRAVNALFDKATSEIASVASKQDYDPEKPFSFEDFPKTKAQLQKSLSELTRKMQAVIEAGARQEWLFACRKNDEFLSSIFDTTKLPKSELAKMQDRNLDALKSFQGRKVGNMGLSDRVWKYTQQYKEQIEIGLDVGLGEGRSAQQLSRDLRQNLKDPDRLFRRVRDKRGNLQLSKAAKAFRPGMGVYRSSYKNAMRLARSEINMAYRESDHLRWQQLDFVVGFEVRRSNHEPQFDCKLCNKLVGRYPKTFKFKGWHPQCMCVCIPILEDFYSKERSDDRKERLRAALRGEEPKKYTSKELVTEFPDGFREWVAENTEKQAGWASTPYFIKDNFVGGDLSKGLIYAPSVTPIQPAPQIKVNTEKQKRHLNPFETEIEKLENIKELTGCSEQEAEDYKKAVNGFSFGWDYEIRCEQSGRRYNPRNGHTVEEVQRKAKDLEDFITKSPKWDGGTTFRGISIPDEDLFEIQERLKSGETLDMLGAASWTTDLSIATDFSEKNLNDRVVNAVIFVCESQPMGTSIRHLSNFFEEQEVLVSSKCKYKHKDAGWWEWKGGKLFIHLVPDTQG